MSDTMQVLSVIISGGQTGVDRAALDAALEFGVTIGGWCPRGRRSEDGRIPDRYPLKETSARSYAARTEWNIRDSDGTLILAMDEITSGTRLTLDLARRLQKPVKVVHFVPDSGAALFRDEISTGEQIKSVVQWIRAHKIIALNVAGPRASSHPEIYNQARSFVQSLLKLLRPGTDAVDQG